MSIINELNQVLKSQLDRLNADELSAEEIQKEVHRTKAITDVSRQMIDAGKLAISAEQLRQEYRGPANGDKKLLSEL